MADEKSSRDSIKWYFPPKNPPVDIANSFRKDLTDYFKPLDQRSTVDLSSIHNGSTETLSQNAPVNTLESQCTENISLININDTEAATVDLSVKVDSIAVNSTIQDGEIADGESRNNANKRKQVPPENSSFDDTSPNEANDCESSPLYKKLRCDDSSLSDDTGSINKVNSVPVTRHKTKAFYKQVLPPEPQDLSVKQSMVYHHCSKGIKKYFVSKAAGGLRSPRRAAPASDGGNKSEKPVSNVESANLNQRITPLKKRKSKVVIEDTTPDDVNNVYGFVDENVTIEPRTTRLGKKSYVNYNETTQPSKKSRSQRSSPRSKSLKTLQASNSSTSKSNLRVGRKLSSKNSAEPSSKNKLESGDSKKYSLRVRNSAVMSPFVPTVTASNVRRSSRLTPGLPPSPLPVEVNDSSDEVPRALDSLYVTEVVEGDCLGSPIRLKFKRVGQKDSLCFDDSVPEVPAPSILPPPAKIFHKKKHSKKKHKKHGKNIKLNQYRAIVKKAIGKPSNVLSNQLNNDKRESGQRSLRQSSILNRKAMEGAQKADQLKRKRWEEQRLYSPPKRTLRKPISQFKVPNAYIEELSETNEVEIPDEVMEETDETEETTEIPKTAVVDTVEDVSVSDSGLKKTRKAAVLAQQPVETETTSKNTRRTLSKSMKQPTDVISETRTTRRTINAFEKLSTKPVTNKRKTRMNKGAVGKVTDETVDGVVRVTRNKGSSTIKSDETVEKMLRTTRKSDNSIKQPNEMTELEFEAANQATESSSQPDEISETVSRTRRKVVGSTKISNQAVETASRTRRKTDVTSKQPDETVEIASRTTRKSDSPVKQSDEISESDSTATGKVDKRAKQSNETSETTTRTRRKVNVKTKQSKLIDNSVPESKSEVNSVNQIIAKAPTLKRGPKKKKAIVTPASSSIVNTRPTRKAKLVAQMKTKSIEEAEAFTNDTDDEDETFSAHRISSKRKEKSNVVPVNYDSGETSESSGKTSAMKNSVKLAPLFCKNKKKDEEDIPVKSKITEVQRQFLMSTAPEILKKPKPTKFSDILDCNHDTFGNLVHVHQKDESSKLWDLTSPQLQLLPEIVCSKYDLSKRTFSKTDRKVTDGKKAFTIPKPLSSNIVIETIKKIEKQSLEIPVKKVFKNYLDCKQLADRKYGANTSNSDSQCSTNKEIRTRMCCDLWTEKYQPKAKSELFGNSSTISTLFSWLQKWKIEAEKLSENLPEKTKSNNSSDSDSDFEPDHKEKPKKPNPKNDEDDDEDDDMMCNTMLLSGAHGIGKTASVYALAKELGFKVFEVNASSRRSGKQIMSQLQEVTQSMQVSKTKETSSVSKPASGIASFFTKTKNGNSDSGKDQVPELKKENSQESLTFAATSLLLFEDIDLVFDEDEGFISAVSNFMAITKRPIILTTNDPNFSLSNKLKGDFEELEFFTPSCDIVAQHLQLLCLAENIMVDLDSVKSLVAHHKCDIRKCMMALQFGVVSGGWNLNSCFKDLVSNNSTNVAEKSEQCNNTTSGCLPTQYGLESVVTTQKFLKLDFGSQVNIIYHYLKCQIDLIQENYFNLLDLPKCKLEVTSRLFQPSQKTFIKIKSPDLSWLNDEKESEEKISGCEGTLHASSRLESSASSKSDDEKSNLIEIKASNHSRKRSTTMQKTLKTLSNYFDNISACDYLLENSMNSELQNFGTYLEPGKCVEEISDEALTLWRRDADISANINTLNFRCANTRINSVISHPDDENVVAIRESDEYKIPLPVFDDRLKIDHLENSTRVNTIRQVCDAVKRSGAIPLTCYFNKSADAQEYMPAIRSICKNEAVRSVISNKRSGRFLHYLNSASVELTPSNQKTLTESFN